MYVGIICACMPGLRTLWRRSFGTQAANVATSPGYSFQKASGGSAALRMGKSGRLRTADSSIHIKSEFELTVRSDSCLELTPTDESHDEVLSRSVLNTHELRKSRCPVHIVECMRV